MRAIQLRHKDAQSIATKQIEKINTQLELDLQEMTRLKLELERLDRSRDHLVSQINYMDFRIRAKKECMSALKTIGDKNETKT